MNGRARARARGNAQKRARVKAEQDLQACKMPQIDEYEPF